MGVANTRVHKRHVAFCEYLDDHPGRQSMARFSGLTKQDVDRVHRYIYIAYMYPRTPEQIVHSGAYVIYEPADMDPNGYRYLALFAEGLSEWHTEQLKRHAELKGWPVSVQHNQRVSYMDIVDIFQSKRVDWNTETSTQKVLSGFWQHWQSMGVKEVSGNGDVYHD